MGEFIKETFLDGSVIAKILISIAILVVAFVVWKLIIRLDRKRVASAATFKVPNGVKSLIKSVYVIIIVLLILGVFDIKLSPLLGGLGIAATIIGLALQDALKDFIMGVNIVAESFFKEGDVVVYNGVEGIVEKLSLKTTIIRQLGTENHLIVSNRNIDKITRCSGIVDLDLGLAYNEDPAEVDRVLKDAAEEIQSIDGISKCLYIGLISFADSAKIYKLRIFAEPQTRGAMKLKAMKVVERRVNDAGLEIPFNQLDVHLDK